MPANWIFAMDFLEQIFNHTLFVTGSWFIDPFTSIFQIKSFMNEEGCITSIKEKVGCSSRAVHCPWAPCS